MERLYINLSIISVTIIVLLQLDPHACNEQEAPISISNKTNKSIYLPLLDYLKVGYNPLAVPVCDNKTKFHVYMDMYLYQLFDLDEPTQMLTIDVWMEMSWFDCMLTWDPSKFNNIKQLTLPAGEIYHPDLIWYQSLHGNFEEGMFLFPQCVARIRNNGLVQLGAQGLLKSFCRIDIRLFPFDLQKCNLTFASWNKDASVFILTKKDTGDSAGHSFKNASNGEWEVMGFPAYDALKRYKLGSDESGNGSLYAEVTFQLSLRRKPTYIKVYLIFPCVLLVWISSLTFLLPLECGEKINLCVTILLSVIVFLLLVAENIPRTSDAIPILGIFFCTSTGLVCLAVLMTTVVLCVGDVEPRTNMPSCLHAIIRSPFMCVMGLQCRFYKSGKSAIYAKQVSSPNSAQSNFTFRMRVEDDEKDDWKILSRLVDRIFFIIYVVLATLNTLYIYAQEPIIKATNAIVPEH